MIEILVDELSVEGIRHVKVVSDLSPIPFPLREGAQLQVHEWSDEALGLHYVEACWECREVVDFHLDGLPRGFRRLAVWKFVQGERVSDVIRQVTEWFFEQTHRMPEFAFVRELPRGVENCVEVDGVMLMQADWALRGCVMVGG